MLDQDVEAQIINFARAAQWEKLTAYIEKQIGADSKPKHIETLTQSGVSDDKKRRLVINWLIDWYNH